eukprot:666766-Lingulodinium_polyedra.AAC.1
MLNKGQCARPDCKWSHDPSAIAEAKRRREQQGQGGGRKNGGKGKNQQDSSGDAFAAQDGSGGGGKNKKGKGKGKKGDGDSSRSSSRGSDRGGPKLCRFFKKYGNRRKGSQCPYLHSNSTHQQDGGTADGQPAKDDAATTTKEWKPEDAPGGGKGRRKGQQMA